VSNGVGRRFVLVDPAVGTREPAFDHTRLAAALAAASGQQVGPEALPFMAIELAGDAVEFDAFGEHWRCRLDSYACERAEFTPPGNPLEVPSPDNKVAVSQRGHALWARSLPDGREWALTTDGEPDFQYGSGPDSTSNGTLLRKFGLPHLPPVVAWSPDSTKVLAHRTDERGVRQTHLVEARPADGGAPLLRTQRYAYAGDENMPRAELVVLDVAEGTVVRAQAEPPLMPQVSPIMSKWAWWAPDGSAVYYLSQPRDLRTLTLHRLEPATGEVTTVLSETGATRVEPNQWMSEPPIVRVLVDEVLWYSQRDGWGHLYRYDLRTGALQGQVTSGQWAVRQILRVDEAERWCTSPPPGWSKRIRTGARCAGSVWTAPASPGSRTTRWTTSSPCRTTRSTSSTPRLRSTPRQCPPSVTGPGGCWSSWSAPISAGSPPPAGRRRNGSASRRPTG
jgi:dipeptidyl-peptidase 4